MKVIIEWRLAPKHKDEANDPEDVEWTEHSRWSGATRGAAEEHAAWLQANQSEPGGFEFRVAPEV